MTAQFLFYYLEGQKTQGPAETSELIQRIIEGRLHALDLIYLEGDSKWRSVAEFEVFAQALNQAAERLRQESQWVLLTKKSPERGKGYIQSGPFSTTVLHERLLSGIVRYTDYVWKKGMKEWRRIGEVEEFRPKQQEDLVGTSTNILFETPPFPSEPAESLLKNVGRVPSAPPVEPVPEEAGTEDLTQPAVRIIEEPKPVSKPERKIETQTDLKVDKPSRAPTIRPPEKRKTETNSLSLFLIWGSCSLVVFATGYYLWSAYRLDGVMAPAPPEAAPTVVASGPVVAPANSAQRAAEASRPEAPPPEPIRPATYVRVQLSDLKGEHPNLIVTSDSNAPELPLQLLFTGQSGHVLDRFSVHRRFSRLLIKGRNEFSLRGFRLPDGELNVRVEVGPGIVDERPFFLGMMDQKYRDRMRAHKKQMSYFFQVERNRLSNMTGQIASTLDELQSNSGSGALRIIKSRLTKFRDRDLKREQNLDNLCLWPFWVEARDVIEDAVQRLEQGLASGAVKISSHDLAERATRLRARIQRESLWR